MNAPKPLPRMAREPGFSAAIQRMAQPSQPLQFRGNLARIDTARKPRQAPQALRFAPGSIERHKRQHLTESGKRLVLAGWIALVSLATYLSIVYQVGTP